MYFVSIDAKGWMYTATQAGAFVSEDKGASWNPLHVLIARKSGKEMDRVPHDYQNIVPDFRGDGVAFPSDQGLHILDRASANFTLISAVGDLHNSMSLSAIISPSADGKSRNIVSNIWPVQSPLLTPQVYASRRFSSVLQPGEEFRAA